MTTEIIDGGALTEREKAVAEYYDNITEEQEEKDRQWAEKNGLLFTGPGALQKAIEVAKARNTANERRMVSFRVPE